MYKTLLATLTATAVSIGAVTAAPAVSKEPLDTATLNTIKSRFGKLMELANKHDFKALHGMFWQSLSTLLVRRARSRPRETGPAFGATKQLIKSCMTSAALARSCSCRIIQGSRLSA
jgi:hypothetical protein